MWLTQADEGGRFRPMMSCIRGGWFLVLAGGLFLAACDSNDEVPKAVAVREDGVMELSLMTFNLR